LHGWRQRILGHCLAPVKIYDCLRFVNVGFESKVSDTLIKHQAASGKSPIPINASSMSFFEQGCRRASQKFPGALGC
jgi:hypothetical protein